MDSVLIVKYGKRYESCQVKIKEIYRKGYFVIATPLNNNDKIELKNLDDIIDLSTMYVKNSKSVYIPINDAKLGDYVVFYDNDAVNVHTGSNVGWGNSMTDAFGRIGKLDHHSNPDCFRVNFGFDSWSIYKSCLKCVNIDLFETEIYQ